ncbi:MAG TPA: hypothetical protein VJ577_15905 [Burkholderiaceae bacterium]|nr:hypothetical protein [Burkholderiaceae bacterium]
MATIELGHGGNYVASPGVQGDFLRRPLFPAIRWGAVLAGVAVGISVQLALALLGIATGLSTMDVAQGDRPGATGPLLWAGLSMLIAAFIGGYVTARMSGLKRKADGVLHGAVSWAVTTLLFAVLATSVTGSMLSSVFSSVTPAVVRSSVGGGNSPMMSMLKNQLGANVDAATLQRLQRDIQAGRRNDAVSLMTGSMGVDQARASTIVDQALILSGSPEQASPQGRAAADQAVGTAGTAAWVVFLAVALSLALGIGGGVLGAIGARRTTWTTTADVVPPVERERT